MVLDDAGIFLGIALLAFCADILYLNRMIEEGGLDGYE
jgi:hypothetical protein